MRKPLLIGAFLLGAIFSGNAQTTLFEDNFDGYADFIISNIGNWTQIDIDESTTYGIELSATETVVFENSGYVGTAIIFNPSATSPALGENWMPRSGAKSLNFFAATDGPNNDYFITPQITLAASGNSLSFWAKSITAQYGLERIRVFVSTTGNTDPASFTAISGPSFTAVPVEWTNYTFSLDAYAGQQVYIAINYLTDDAFALLVDDFSVSTTLTAGVKDALASQFSVFPNPATNVINVSNNNNILVDGIQIVDLNGRTVKSVKFDGVASAEVNISDLSSGMYMMTVSSDKGTMTKKIVKN